MKKLEEISVYDRKWSSISLLYRVDQVKKHLIKSPSIRENFILRRRSDYFYIQHSSSSSRIFLPDSKYREFWQFLLLSIIIYQNTIIIYLLTYTSTYTETHFCLLLISDFAFLLEIFLNFNTGYFSDGVLINDRKSIIKKYLKSYFFFDCLACFPFQTLIPQMSFQAFPSVSFTKSESVMLLWSLKLLNNFKLKKIFENFQCHFSSQLVHTLFHLIKFLLSAISTIHITSCLMFAVFYKDLKETGMMWDFVFEHEQNTYLRFFYMIVTTMTSTGYGDITPFSIHMKALACGIMCLSCWLFAFLLTNSRDILLKYNAQDIFFREALLKIKKYLRSKKVNKRLNFRIINYLKHMKQNSRKSHLNEEKILNDLSIPLREEVYTITRGKVLSKCHVFRNYSYDFLKILIRSLANSVYAPGDIIIKEGELTDSIYFITKGKIEIFHQKTHTVFKELGERKYFGEISFFLQRPRSCSARSLLFTDVFYLSKLSMNTILMNRPKDYEYHRVFVLQAHIDISLLSVKCYLCSKIGHIAKDCKTFVIVIDNQRNIVEANNRRYQMFKKVKVKSSPELQGSNKNILSAFGIQQKFSKNKFRYQPDLRSKCKEFLQEAHLLKYRSNIEDGRFFSNESELEEFQGSNSLLPIENQFTSNFIRQRSPKSEWKVNETEQKLNSNETFTFGNIFKSNSSNFSDDLFTHVNH